MESVTLQVTGDGSHTLFVPALNETYHSHHGALQESAHVFIDHGLLHAVQQQQLSHIRVFEVGFGTGLNALLTLQAEMNNAFTVLYTSLEPYPVSLEVAMQLNYPTLLGQTALASLFEALHAAPWNTTEAIIPGFTLDKRTQKLEEFQATEGNGYDVVFFDAFAPNKQSELWQPAALQVVFGALRPGAVLTTYCSQGQFRRNLAQVGFAVYKIPGPPGKREMVRAFKPHQ